MTSLYDYVIFTDGSCLGNPGPGGWAVIIRCINEESQSETILRGNSKGESTTNNIMELTAVLRGLEYISPHSKVAIFSDSKYIIDCFVKKWYTKWIKNGWHKSDGGPVLNAEIWKEIFALVDIQEKISWNWVRAHSGDVMNERCDEIAQEEAERGRRNGKR